MYKQRFSIKLLKNVAFVLSGREYLALVAKSIFSLESQQYVLTSHFIYIVNLFFQIPITCFPCIKVTILRSHNTGPRNRLAIEKTLDIDHSH
jgi:hypothetical protein